MGNKFSKAPKQIHNITKATTVIKESIPKTSNERRLLEYRFTPKKQQVQYEDEFTKLMKTNPEEAQRILKEKDEMYRKEAEILAKIAEQETLEDSIYRQGSTRSSLITGKREFTKDSYKRFENMNATPSDYAFMTQFEDKDEEYLRKLNLLASNIVTTTPEFPVDERFRTQHKALARPTPEDFSKPTLKYSFSYDRFWDPDIKFKGTYTAKEIVIFLNEMRNLPKEKHNEHIEKFANEHSMNVKDIKKILYFSNTYVEVEVGSDVYGIWNM